MSDRPRSFTSRINISQFVPGSLLYSLALFVGGPYMVYALFSERLPSVQALLISALVPLAGIGYDGIRKRALNLVALLSLTLIIWIWLSSLFRLDATTQTLVRYLVPVAALGLLLLLSQLFPRPLWFFIDRYTHTDNEPAQRALYQEYWDSSSDYRATIGRFNITWGCAQIAFALIFAGLFFVLPSTIYVTVLPVALLLPYLALLLWTIGYREQQAPHWQPQKQKIIV